MIKVNFVVWRLEPRDEKGNNPVKRWEREIIFEDLDNLPNNATKFKIDDVFFDMDDVVYSYESKRFTIGTNINNINLSTDIDTTVITSNDQVLDILLSKGWTLQKPKPYKQPTQLDEDING